MAKYFCFFFQLIDGGVLCFVFWFANFFPLCASFVFIVQMKNALLIDCEHSIWQTYVYCSKFKSTWHTEPWYPSCWIKYKFNRNKETSDYNGEKKYSHSQINFGKYRIAIFSWDVEAYNYSTSNLLSYRICVFFW